MAKFCTNCGAELMEGAAFCTKCGTRVPTVQPEPETVQPPVPDTEELGSQQPVTPAAEEAPIYQEEAPIYSESAPAFEDSGSMPPAPKKKRSFKALIAVLSAIVGVLVVFAVICVVLNILYAPGKTVDNFLAALEAQDYTALTACASSGDSDYPLDEAAANALFALYADSSSFRSHLEKDLEEEADLIKDHTMSDDDYLFVLVREKHVIYSTYHIKIYPSTVTVSSDLPGTEVTFGSQTVTIGRAGSGLPDTIENYSSVLYDSSESSISKEEIALLPGLYEGTASYTNALGQVLSFPLSVSADEEEIDVSVSADAFDSCVLTVYNGAGRPVDLYCNGEKLCTIGIYTDINFAMLTAGTELSFQPAEDMSGADYEVSEVSYTQTASWGELNASVTVSKDTSYYEVYFPYITIYNWEEYPVKVSVNGNEVGSIIAYGNWPMSPVLSGMEISIVPDSTLDIVPYVYQVDAFTDVYEGDYSIYPEYTLSDAAKDSLLVMLNDTVTDLFSATYALDIDSMNAMPQISIVEQMIEVADDIQTWNDEEGYHFCDVLCTITSFDYSGDPYYPYYLEIVDGTLVIYARITMVFDFTYTYYNEDGSVWETSPYEGNVYSFGVYVNMVDGQWVITGD